MRVTVLTIVALVGLLGLPASIAGEITVFLVRQNVDQNLQQDDVVKPNDRVQTRDGGLVVLVESETLTRATGDRGDPECLYWTVIPANTTHFAKSSAGRGCGNDTGALDRALASAESGGGQLVKAAFRVVHPPALVRGDQPASESEKAVYRFEDALREIPLEPPKPRGPRDVPIQPRINEQEIEMSVPDLTGETPRFILSFSGDQHIRSHFSGWLPDSTVDLRRENDGHTWRAAVDKDGKASSVSTWSKFPLTITASQGDVKLTQVLEDRGAARYRLAWTCIQGEPWVNAGYSGWPPRGVLSMFRENDGLKTGQMVDENGAAETVYRWSGGKLTSVASNSDVRITAQLGRARANLCD